MLPLKALILIFLSLQDLYLAGSLSLERRRSG
jgi:hypothetical protein